MTRDEIMAMQPGRELDALVAEKVMGWRYEDGVWFIRTVGGVQVSQAGETWSPSTDISAAWEVVEKLRKDSLNLNIYMYTFGCLTYVSTSKGLALQEVKCDAAPEAICKAALLAVMEGVNA